MTDQVRIVLKNKATQETTEPTLAEVTSEPTEHEVEAAKAYIRDLLAQTGKVVSHHDGSELA